MFGFLNSFFDSNLDLFNKLEYIKMKNYFAARSINDTFPELFDRNEDQSLICMFDLDDCRFGAEITFDDDKCKYCFHDVYRVVDYKTKYGNIADLKSITERNEILDIVNRINRKARL